MKKFFPLLLAAVMVCASVPAAFGDDIENYRDIRFSLPPRFTSAISDDLTPQNLTYFFVAGNVLCSLHCSVFSDFDSSSDVLTHLYNNFLSYPGFSWINYTCNDGYWAFLCSSDNDGDPYPLILVYTPSEIIMLMLIGSCDPDILFEIADEIFPTVLPSA